MTTTGSLTTSGRARPPSIRWSWKRRGGDGWPEGPPVEQRRSREMELLLASGRLCLRTFREEDALALLRIPLDWTHLLDTAEEEGMGGLLAFQLVRLSRVCPLDLPLDLLTRTLHRIAARNMALLAELAALREDLRQRGLRAIVLKGGALIETVYGGHPGLRPLSDLDLLIGAGDLPVVGEVLQRRGFHPISPSSTFFVKGSAAIDIHPDLIGTARIKRRALAVRFDAEALWREAVPLDPADPTLLVLSPLHQLLHLAVHALKHSFCRLIWFVDLGLVLKQVRWEELEEGARASGTLRPLAYALFGLRALMGVEAPLEALASLPRPNRVERAFLRAVVDRKEIETLGELVMAFSIPGFTAKLAYVLEIGFPRREALAEVFPSTPSWLLYPSRLLQAGALGVREGRHVAALVKRRNG